MSSPEAAPSTPTPSPSVSVAPLAVGAGLAVTLGAGRLAAVGVLGEHAHQVDPVLVLLLALGTGVIGYVSAVRHGPARAAVFGGVLTAGCAFAEVALAPALLIAAAMAACWPGSKE